MSLSERALCSVDDVMGFIPLKTPTSADTEQLEFFINTVSLQIENFCNVHFKPFSVVDQVSGAGTKVLTPSKSPVISVGEIWEDSNLDFSTSSIVPSGDYEVVNSNTIIKKDGVWGKGLLNVKLEYTAGFEVVPIDIKFATAVETAKLWKNRKDLDSNTMTVGGDVVAKSNNMFSQLTKDILNVYKVKSFL